MVGNVCTTCLYRIPPAENWGCTRGFDLEYDDIFVTGCPEYVPETKFHVAGDGLPSDDDGFY